MAARTKVANARLGIAADPRVAKAIKYIPYTARATLHSTLRTKSCINDKKEYEAKAPKSINNAKKPAKVAGLETLGSTIVMYTMVVKATAAVAIIG